MRGHEEASTMDTTGTTEGERQQFTFQAEIKQLLHLLSHSLYQSREIAVRELVSNASDALDKMRYVSLTDEVHKAAGPLEIVIEGREGDAQLVIRDTGVGMTRDELVTNLGTIAHSGSVEFLQAMAAAGQSKSEVSLIGQFGVGFYAAFMIADRVRVRSRSYREEAGWEWESDGSGSFSVAPAGEGLPRGTEVVLHLKDDAREFAADWRIRDVVRRFSSFVPHPVRLKEGGEVLNEQKPIWVEPKNQVTDEQHNQFYQYLTHHIEEKPLWRLHMAADSPIQFRAVLYCPTTNIERLGFPRLEHGLHLCARRVLVQNECRELLPEYLRFLHGLVDSEDLPLNVSRETLQDNTVIRKIRSALVKGVLGRLDALASESPEDFLTFHGQFGAMLKEGLISGAVDASNALEHRERIAGLLRFTSSHGEALTSLDQYLERMVEGQTRIYYLGGPDLGSVSKSPNLEIFRRKGIEVLFLVDPIDEFAITALRSYKGKELTSIEEAELGLPETKDGEATAKASADEDKGASAETERAAADRASDMAGFTRVLDLFRAALGDRVGEVRESKRLIDSPCCLVNAPGGISTQMRRVLKMANKEFPDSPRVLEVNPSSPLVKRLRLLSANPDHDGFIKQCALQLWTNAMVLEGMTPEPEDLVARVQTFMAEAAEKRSPLVL